MKAYEKFDLLNNATKQGERLVNELSMIDSLQNVRGVGLLVAFDMKNKKSRDIFVDQLRNAGMICNPTGEKSVRLRPNLAVSSHEVKLAVDTIKGCIR
jgi:acetylornithine/succinyldiaminopimelate/putrescine aminotransferase